MRVDKIKNLTKMKTISVQIKTNSIHFCLFFFGKRKEIKYYFRTEKKIPTQYIDHTKYG